MAKEITSIKCTHSSLMRYMKRNYPWLENNFKHFSGSIEIPMIGLNSKQPRKSLLKSK